MDVSVWCLSSELVFFKIMVCCRKPLTALLRGSYDTAIDKTCSLLVSVQKRMIKAKKAAELKQEHSEEQEVL